MISYDYMRLDDPHYTGTVGFFHFASFAVSISIVVYIQYRIEADHGSDIDGAVSRRFKLKDLVSFDKDSENIDGNHKNDLLIQR